MWWCCKKAFQIIINLIRSIKYSNYPTQHSKQRSMQNLMKETETISSEGAYDEKYCANCGAKINDGDSFCVMCGKPIE